MGRSIVYSDYTAEDYEEAILELKRSRPDHEFRAERASVPMFGEQIVVVGILDVEEDEITLLT